MKECVVYFTEQFLEVRNTRAWRIAFLTFDKIILPIKNVKAFAQITPSDKQFYEWIKGNMTDVSPQKMGDDRGELNPLSMEYKRICEYDQKIASRVSHCLLPVSKCGFPEIEAIMRMIYRMQKKYNGSPVPHERLYQYLEDNLPADKFNNFPWANLECLYDLLIGARLQQTGRASVFIDRHDLDVMYLLQKKSIPFVENEKELNIWTKGLHFQNTSDLVKCLIGSSFQESYKNVDKLIRIEVSAFDDIPISEIIKFKKKDKKKALVTKIQELQSNTKLKITDNLLAETVQNAYKEAFDILRPTNKKLWMAILGSLPTGPIPINPFSVISLAQEINIRSNGNLDWLMVLNDLGHLSQNLEKKHVH